jgi:hypothetical protein
MIRRASYGSSKHSDGSKVEDNRWGIFPAAMIKGGEAVWFDNLDPEAIRARLLAEGDFTKLLESLGVNDQDDDDGQEPPTLEELFPLLEAAVEDILLPRFNGTSNAEVVKPQINCKHIRANNGIGVLEVLDKAKKSIHVTHIIPELYVEPYVELQLEKVWQGLIFERIVYKNPAYPQMYKWLERFRDKDGHFIKRYREYTIEGDPVLPLPQQDFMVIDKKYVLLWHRVTNPESETLTFIEDEATAGYFLNWWNSLIPKEGQQRKVVEMVCTASGQ